METLAAAGAVEQTRLPLGMWSVGLPQRQAPTSPAAEQGDDPMRLAGEDPVATLRLDPSVVRVELDRTRTVEGLPNDPDYAEEWSLPRIGWDKVYGRVKPVGQAIVALLDTGVDASHPDLAGSLVPGTSVLSTGDDGTTDPNGHGTWMAGIIAAATDNGIGVAGIGYAGVRVMPVVVLGADGTGRDSDVIAGVVWAVQHGADVINMSFSNPGFSASLQTAIDYAWERNVVVVAATGNDGTSIVTYPAGDRGVVGVSNTDRTDALHASSNYGDDVFLAAPGTGIYTTAAGGGYAWVTGTSASSAAVAAAAALMRAVDPAATNGQIVNRLAENADPAGSVTETGNGRLNLARAIADTSTASIEPNGAGPLGDGGPIVGPYVAAATRTWSGALSSAWGLAGNWQENAVPIAGDDLVFPAGASNLAMTNGIAAGTSFNSVTFSGNGYSVTGNSITLAGSISDSATGGLNTISIAIATTAVRTITVTSSSETLTITSVVSGAGGISKAGSGTLRLSGVNTYSGATTISAGTLTAAANQAMGTAAGSTSITAGATLAFDGGITYSTAEAVTVNGTGVGGNGAVLNVSGANSFAGAITLGSASTIGSTASSLTASGAIVNGGFLMTTGGAGNIALSGVVSGTGGLTKNGTGTLTLSGASANTYSGATTVNTGGLDLNKTAGVNAFAGSLVVGDDAGGAGADVLRLLAANQIPVVTVTVKSSGLLNLNNVSDAIGALTVNSGTSNAASVTTGTGTLTLGGTVTLTVVGSGATGATISGNLGLGANRIFNVADDGTTVTDLTVSAVVSGAFSLTKQGAGTLVLSGVNTYTGVTTISAGTVSASSIVVSGSASNLGNAASAVILGDASNKGTLSYTGSTATYTRGFTLNAGGGQIDTTTSGQTLTIGTAGITAGGLLTIGGAGNTTISSVISSTGGLTKQGAGTLVLSGVNTYTGVTTISAGTVNIAADTGLGTAPGSPTAGRLTFGGGTLATTATFTLNSNRGIAFGSTGTIDVASATTLTYGGIATGAGGLTKQGAGTLELSGATVTIADFTITAGTLVAPTATTFSVAGDWTNNASISALSAGTGTVTLNGTSAGTVGGLFSTTFNSLTLNNGSGITLSANVTVDGTLTFTSGMLTTGSNTLYVASSGSVSRTSGHVVGNFRKYVATGATSRTFEVGDASNYTPVSLSFANVTAAGDLTVSASNGDHPNIAGSILDSSKSANRYWTLANGGITFTTYSPTFTFVGGDVDAGADTTYFIVGRYSGGTWSPEATTTRTATSTQATGITGFGDFAVGEPAQSALDHFDVTAPASTAAGSAFNVTVTALDAAGNTVTSYTGTITFSSTDANATFSPPSYDFMAGDHGTKAFTGGATLKAAGTQTVSVSGSSRSGTSGSITVNPGAFTRLQLLVPGETAAPGSAGGKTGTPSAQTAGSAFSVTVNAVDAYWNLVTAVTDTVAITSSDSNAVLPANAALAGGTNSFSVTLKTAGSRTVTASDVTDPAKTADTSPAITVNPGAAASLVVVAPASAASGTAFTVTVTAMDAHGNIASGYTGTVHVTSDDGSASLPADYTFVGGDAGVHAFSNAVTLHALGNYTVTATDTTLPSITGTSSAILVEVYLESGSGWATSFSGTRYLALRMPAYVPAGAVVTAATFAHGYRSASAADTICYYFEVYSGAALLGTHGSAGSPASCTSGAAFQAESFSLPEVDTAAKANSVVIKLYLKDSGAARSQHSLATLQVTYSLP